MENRPDYNWGIVTGAVSGIIVVDIDDPIGEEILKPHGSVLVLLRFSGELFAHSRSAISNWTGLR